MLPLSNADYRPPGAGLGGGSPASAGSSTTDRLNLDVDQRGWLGLGRWFDMLFGVSLDMFFKLGLLGLRLGVVDGLQIFVDGVGRRLGGLVDKELDSGLRHFNRYGINEHEIILLSRKLPAAHLRFVNGLG